MIGGVTQVVIEVEDQERAKAFWTQTLGFELVQDAACGQERGLEVRTPDKAVVVVLELRRGPADRGHPEPADLERVLLRRGPAAYLPGAERPRRAVPPAARSPAELGVQAGDRGDRRRTCPTYVVVPAVGAAG